MEKITLAGKDYELPKVSFGTLSALGKLGFNTQLLDDPIGFLPIVVAYIANVTIKEAENILEEDCYNVTKLRELSNILRGWIVNSDFFKDQQANMDNK